MVSSTSTSLLLIFVLSSSGECVIQQNFQQTLAVPHGMSMLLSLEDDLPSYRGNDLHTRNPQEGTQENYWQQEDVDDCVPPPLFSGEEPIWYYINAVRDKWRGLIGKKDEAPAVMVTTPPLTTAATVAATGATRTRGIQSQPRSTNTIAQSGHSAPSLLASNDIEDAAGRSGKESEYNMFTGDEPIFHLAKKVRGWFGNLGFMSQKREQGEILALRREQRQQGARFLDVETRAPLLSSSSSSGFSDSQIEMSSNVLNNDFPGTGTRCRFLGTEAGVQGAVGIKRRFTGWLSGLLRCRGRRNIHDEDGGYYLNADSFQHPRVEKGVVYHITDGTAGGMGLPP